MKKHLFVGATLVIASAFCSNLDAQTGSKPSSASASPSPTTTPSPKPNARPLPFHGMVSAVDQKVKTFTITGKQASRVFKVTDKTVISKGAGAAAMKDIVENEEISGSYWKNVDGTCEAKMVKLGPMTSGKKASSPLASPVPSGKP